MIVVLNSGVFGRNMKYLREKRGISMDVLAKMTHITVNSLREIEDGLTYDIDANTYLRLCRIFEITGEDVGKIAEFELTE